MKKVFLASVLLLSGIAAFAQTRWVVDPVHSSIKFSVSHMLVSETEGSFKKYTGNIITPDSDFTNAEIDFTVDVNSINTESDMRDKHLKADDFFNAEKYPQMTFKSNSFKKVRGKYVLIGDLTVRDVTKKVKFDVVFGGTAPTRNGGSIAGFKATTTIDRTAYNIKGGIPGVGKDVTLTLKLEFAQAKS